VVGLELKASKDYNL